MIISVLVARPLDGPFSYRCPDELSEELKLGGLVMVPFGRQELIGCIWSLDEVEAEARLAGRSPRAISGLLDGLPELPAPLRSLIERLARYYHCPLGEALKLALPHIASQKGLTLTGEGRALKVADSALPQSLKMAFEALRALMLKRPLRAQDLPFSISRSEWASLRELGLIRESRYPRLSPPVAVFESAREPMSLKKATRSALLMNQLHQACASGGGLSPAQLTEALSELQPELNPGKMKKALRALIEAGALKLSPHPLGHPSSAASLDSGQAEAALSTRGSPHLAEKIVLTAEQRAAVERVSSAEGFMTYLLHGVTGSGKTEVYLELIRERLSAGQSALVLVPEIGLTPQTIRRFEEQLSAPVYPWHSELSPSERLELWCELGSEEPKVLVGARSALFAPLKTLGLIIVDECHDSSYKQGEGLRYHAKDMAVVRGMLSACPVILGSATPSLECMENAQRGKYTLLQLRERPLGAALPEVQLVDLRSARIVSDQAPAFSLQLAEAVRRRLMRGEQSILYLNRRGFSQSVRCVQCGFQFKCRSCEITLPWHGQSQRLECHHCDFKAPLPHQCPDCQRSGSFLPIGRGTERIEQQVKALFPQARLLRLDRDSGVSPLELEGLMRGGEIDILIGTQMVTKGHDFPLVTLVGVLDADGALDLPDFRAAERCYQLISQVSGRAGRAERPGEVIIQTYRPGDELLQAARYHDYGRFIAFERQLRAAVGYPPFCYMVALRVEGIAGDMLDFALTKLSNVLDNLNPELRRVGPTLAPLSQLKGRRRWITLLRHPERRCLHESLTALRAQLSSCKWPQSVRLVIDVDPIDFF